MNIQNKIDKFLPVGKIIREAPYIMGFKTTNYCWYQCPHCCESSCPKNGRKFISLDVIYSYLNQAVQDPQFSGHVVFTGGEIMSSYLFGDPKYVPTILKWCLSANLSTDIKTNAGWARAGFGKQIYNDLATVINEYPQGHLQISLSLDNFHKNALENNARVLEQLAGDVKHRLAINIVSFSDSLHLYPELLKRLRSRGVRTDDAMLIDNKTGTVETVTVLNGNIIVQHRNSILFDGGRARGMSGAIHTEFPQFKFMCAPGNTLMKFDVDGMVTLGENSGRKIGAPWLANKNKIYTLQGIKKALVFDARIEELRARIFDGWRGQRK